MEHCDHGIPKEELRASIQQFHWFHTFEIAPGVMTPGYNSTPFNARDILNSYFRLDESLAGKRILEIGTWDGFYAFELEARQADVVATDIQNPDDTGFNFSKKLFNSHVQYVRCSVYDLRESLEGEFDIVLFMGVFYHLKYPLLAFEQIYQILKKGGILLFEGEAFLHYAETFNQLKIWPRLALSSLLLTLLAHSDIPVTLSYSPGYYKDVSNWFIPNTACLRSWLRATGFETVELHTLFPHVQFQPRRKLKYFFDVLRYLISLRGSIEQRAWGIAHSTETPPAVEHPLAPGSPGIPA